MTQQPIRILHLDDDPIDAELVKLALETAAGRFPASITYVQTKEQFSKALGHGRFEIILSDYRMPGFDGDEALKLAQERCPEVPFIMVTGELGEERAIETLHRGATDYVLKDRMFRLIPAMERALAEAENQRKRHEAERERESLLEEIQRRQGELLAVIQAMHGGVMVFDKEGTIVLVNEAEAVMLGYSHASELKRDLSFFIENFEFEYDDGTIVPIDDWPVNHVMRGESVVNRELKGRHKETGKEWFFSFSGQPVRDETGKQILSVLVTRDVSERKQAEEALHGVHRATEEILESVQDPFYSLDSEWHFTYVNSKAEEFLGKSRTELLGNSLWELFPVLLGTESERSLRTAKEMRTPIHYEGRSTLKDVWVDVHLFPKADGGISVLYRDISERKVQELALRLSEERFLAAFRGSPYPQAISRVRDGVFLDANDAYLSFLNIRREELVGHSSFELGILAEPKEREALVDQLRRNGRVDGFEMHIKTRTGAERIVIVSVCLLTVGEEQTMLTIVNDITDHRQLQGDLERQNRELDAERLKWRTLIEGIADEVWACDAAGKMSMLNLATKTAMGLTEFEGKPLAEVLQEVEILRPDGSIRPEDEAPLLRSLKGEVVRGEEIMRHRETGRTRFRHYSATPVRDAEGKITGAVAIVSDITDAKLAEQDIRRLNEELEERVSERTEKLERLNREMESFGYTVAHDLKAPLRAIDSFTQLLSNSREKNALSAEQLRYIALLQSSTGLMNTLIENLLAFSRTVRLVPQRAQVDMFALAKEVLEEQRWSLGEAAERVEVILDELPLAPMADPVLMRQVFANLLSNAFKFTRKTESPRIEIGGYRNDGQIVYYVRDNGVGFPKDQAEKLFTVFTRLHSKEEFEGTGVGLASVKKIVERHGGEVCADGEEGKGATFYFSLPGSA